MFAFLKDKLKKAIGSFSRKVEEEVPEKEEKKEVELEIVEQPVEEEKKVEREKVEEKAEKKKEKKPEKEKVEVKTEVFKEEKKEEEIEVDIEKELKEEGKKGIFARIKERIVTKKISEEKFEELFYELEIALMENNVAVSVIENIKEDLKKELVEKSIKRGDIEKRVRESLKESIEKLFDVEGIDLISKIKEKEGPFVIVFVGVNGSGKTTTIAKVANFILKNKLKCVLGAADTFRSGAREQLEEWGKRLKVEVVGGQYNADPASVAFDTIAKAKAHGIDAVLIDTAGRQHGNTNLMQEMKKIIKVAKPDLKIFIGEAITGNDVVEQSVKFNEVIGIDGIILTKADVDEKGGALISSSYVTKKPILYLGIGQSLNDLEKFDKDKIINGLGF